MTFRPATARARLAVADLSLALHVADEACDDFWASTTRSAMMLRDVLLAGNGCRHSVTRSGSWGLIVLDCFGRWLTRFTAGRAGGLPGPGAAPGRPAPPNSLFHIVGLAHWQRQVPGVVGAILAGASVWLLDQRDCKVTIVATSCGPQPAHRELQHVVVRASTAPPSRCAADAPAVNDAHGQSPRVRLSREASTADFTSRGAKECRSKTSVMGTSKAYHFRNSWISKIGAPWRSWMVFSR